MKNFASIIAIVFISAFCGFYANAAPNTSDENAVLKARIATLEQKVKDLEEQLKFERELFAKMRNETRGLKRSKMARKSESAKVESAEKASQVTRVKDASDSIKSRREKKEEEVDDMDTTPRSTGFHMFPF